MPQKPQSDRWFAWALVAVAALVITNAGWFYRWKIREVEHVERVNALVASQPRAEPRVVYEYREPTAAREPTSGAAAGSPQSARPVAPTRDAAAGEECVGGVIFRRTEDGIESSGERCTR